MSTPQLINGTRFKVWCPMCEKNDREPTILAPWVSPAAVLVCVYGVCAKCAKTMQATPEALRPKLMDKVEQHLLAKYPELWDRLPKGYGVQPAPDKPADE